MQSILDIALEYAEKNNAKKIIKINLEIGELSGILSDWMQQYFDFVTEGTIAENAKLDIKRIPAIIRCRVCGKEFGITGENMDLSCPECNDKWRIEIVSGREYYIKSIEVD